MTASPDTEPTKCPECEGPLIRGCCLAPGCDFLCDPVARAASFAEPTDDAVQRAEAERVARGLCHLSDRYHANAAKHGGCDKCKTTAGELLAYGKAQRQAERKEIAKERMQRCTTRFTQVPVDGCVCDNCVLFRMENEKVEGETHTEALHRALRNTKQSEGGE